MIAPSSVETLWEASMRCVPGGIVASYLPPAPARLIIERGLGSRVFDVDGSEYLDWIMGSASIVLGHAYPTVVEAVREQVARGTQFYATTEASARLVAELVEAIPCAEQVKLVGDGAEATFYALRLARAATQRDKVLMFAGSYHGHHDYAQVGATAGIPAAINELVLTCPYNDLASAVDVMERYAGELAAVIVEPFHRVLAPNPGFLEGLRDAATRLGIVLIFDEVVTGFRLAYGGAQERYGVTPDLACYGKSLGGGLPIGAIAGPRHIMELTIAASDNPSPAFVAGTLNGNPLSCVAALATLQVLRETDAYAYLAKLGEHLRKGLREVAKMSPVPLHITGDAGITGVIVADGDPADPRILAAVDRVCAAKLESGLFERGHLVRVPYKWLVSTAHTVDEVDRLIEDVSQVCANPSLRCEL